jgi:ABC-type oligopeptide transport system substrate-binding subunit
LLASTQVRASGSNLSGYQDTAMDPLLEAARAPGTADASKAAWTALLAALNERQPILPLAWTDDVVLVRGVEGMTPRLISGPGDRFWDVLAWRLAADR